MRFHVLINSQSGTSLKLGQEKIEQSVYESLDVESFHFLSGDEYFAKMKELVDSPTPLLIGGGDGSIAKAAELHLEKDKPFGVLPFGTMNMLAMDIGIPADFYDSIKAYKNTKIMEIDVGMANDAPFLCCAAFGSMPEAAKLREEHRGQPNILMMPRVAAFVYNRLDFMRKRQIRLTLDGSLSRVRTGMLIISNNQYSPVSAQEPFKRDSLRDGVLGIYTVTPKSLWDKLRLVLSLKSGAWKSDPSVTETRANTVVLNTNRKSELISIDGEPSEMKMPLRCSILPKALQMIVPVPVEIEKAA